jgi:hypothetical protein
MSLTLGTVIIGSHAFATNPKVQEVTSEFLQVTKRSINGTLVSSYVPKPGDSTKIMNKKTFNISGIDPDIDQIEDIAEELEKAPPLYFKDAKGGVYSVYLVDSLQESLDADRYKTREYSFSVAEV